MSAKRGQPARPRLNVRTAPEEIEAERNSYPEGHPFRDMLGDGKGLDFRLEPPPWDEFWQEQMESNLARLRVDPKASNYEALEISLVRAIAGLEPDFLPYHDVGRYFCDLLAEWDAETAKRIFGDVLRMRKAADEPPHRNFLAYRAYCDFLLEFGFEPSMPRLTEFVKAKPTAYPVGISTPTGSKEWWQMFFEAGLVRLAE
jgi:hypothetical protein